MTRTDPTVYRKTRNKPVYFVLFTLGFPGYKGHLYNRVVNIYLLQILIEQLRFLPTPPTFDAPFTLGGPRRNTAVTSGMEN